MAEARASYRKTAWVAGLALGIGVLLLGLGLFAALSQSGWGPALWLAWGATTAIVAAGSAWSALVAWGARVALARDALESAGRPYAPRGRREAVSGLVPGLVSLALRALGRLREGKVLHLRPGELVEVRGLDEILATLDGQGTLNGLPFMPEMIDCCGRRFRVLRRIEKLNDYIGKTGLRRMRAIVLLEGPRCDGSAHGGCQANCHLRWHEAWLRRARGSAAAPAGVPVLAPGSLPVLRTEGGEERYVCQATELTAGSTPLRRGDPRLYLREWLVGNVRLGAFLTGIALVAFRWLQHRRSGATYPLVEPRAGSTTPDVRLVLQPGELVRVKSKREIELTLNDQARNRGLYFDGEMLRHCGGLYRVHSRLERTMVERTGKLVTLKNPTVILEGATATGEYVAFNGENEHIFWREAWLERAERTPEAAESATEAVAGVLPQADAPRPAAAQAS